MHVGMTTFFQNIGRPISDYEVYRHEISMADLAEPLGFDFDLVLWIIRRLHNVPQRGTVLDVHGRAHEACKAWINGDGASLA